jgi:hypothetical protein
VRKVSVDSAEAPGADSAVRHRRVRASLGAGALAVALLSSPSIAAASEAPHSQPSPAAQAEPLEPAPQSDTTKAPPPRPTPPPHPTPKPKPPPTAKPTQKPKPTPRAQTPSHQATGEQPTGNQGPGQAPGDQKPVRPDEPPAAPATLDPAAPGESPPAGAPAGNPGRPKPTSNAPGAPFPQIFGPQSSRVRLVVAGATVSGIAAVAGWLVLGGRRKRAAVPAARETGSITLVDGIVRIVPERASTGRYSGRVPPSATPTIWRAHDDRPRWLRRLNDQQPPRTPALDPSLDLDEDPMPWLAAVAWPDRTDALRDDDRRDDEDRVAQ